MIGKKKNIRFISLGTRKNRQTYINNIIVVSLSLLLSNHTEGARDELNSWVAEMP